MERNVDASTSQAQPAPVSAQAGAAQHVSPREQLAQQIATSGGAGDGGILAQLTSNPFFTAGFGLAGLGVALSWGQKGIRQGAALLRRRLLVDVEITSRDRSYQWFLRWMTAHQRGQLETVANPAQASFTNSMIRRFMPGIHHLSVQTSSPSFPPPSGAAPNAPVSLVPGPGRHFLLYQNALVAMNRQRDSKMYAANAEPFETITLTTLYSHRHIFKSMFTEAHDLALRETEGKTTIYTMSLTEWKQFGQPKRKRPLDSVVLDTGIKERIVDDVRNFLSARSWYLDRGIPYRRGYLLYGPPGTGKSSFIEALAGELDFDIGMLHLSQRGLTDDLLYKLLSNIPPRTLVLLEDADAAFSNRRQQSDEHGYRGANVTYSGLLNALDGVVSAEERIVFLTTNYIERLDEAIVRPGRVDMTIRLGDASEQQFDEMWRRFYAEQDTDGQLLQQFMAKCKGLGLVGRVSTATLQGLFLFNKDDPEGAIHSAELMASRAGERTVDARPAAPTDESASSSSVG